MIQSDASNEEQHSTEKETTAQKSPLEEAETFAKLEQTCGIPIRAILKDKVLLRKLKEAYQHVSQDTKQNEVEVESLIKSDSSVHITDYLAEIK